MSKIGDKLAVIRENVGKMIDTAKRAEEIPEKRVSGKFVSIKFPVIKQGFVNDQGNEIQQSKEE